jgi:hypothetical protein
MRCALSTQSCCLTADGGTCIGLEERCPGGVPQQAFCDRRIECQEALDASDAVCCLSNNFAYSCQRGPCGGGALETCLLGANPSECTDPTNKHCTPYFMGYSVCE